MFQMEATICFGQMKEEIRHRWGIPADTWGPGWCEYEQVDKENWSQANLGEHRNQQLTPNVSCPLCHLAKGNLRIAFYCFF